ncbi:sulfotransferase [Pseudomaricurvus sp. HS19]|uniref:tetratricopeptide repeat-containing sulfotransferase family protein n=1 Tax=Pseudomaricurvus sp. HS19 TaxID=2692626 RepID=UPI00136F7626|nr:sulfotransferase [Pseudomaricurvus sp. HS19]MYM61801.1 tetratricopeptide repeat protein [Pseudomaricurvus sp. HS19]
MSKKKPNKKLSKTVNIRINPTGPIKSMTIGAVLEQIQTAKNAKHFGAVEFLCRQLLDEKPGLEEAYLPLFMIYHELGKYPELEDIATRCLEHCKKFTPAYLHLSFVYRRKQQHQKALDAIRKALKIEPDNARILNNLGVAYKESGDLEKALEAFNKCVKLDANYVQPYWNRADLYKDITSEEIARMEIFANSTRKPDSDRALLYYSLARASEHRHEYKACIDYLNIGAPLKKSCINYDHNREIDEHEAIKKIFTPNMLKGVSSLSFPAKPIFICGLPRSGTTLIEQILSSHSCVTAGDELIELSAATSELRQQKRPQEDSLEWFSDLDIKDWEWLGKRYMALTSELHREANGFFTDKMMINYKAIGVIHKALPDAIIIDCRRNPLDNIFACYKQHFQDGLKFTYDLNDLTDYYLAYHNLMDYWKKHVSNNIVQVSYDDLVHNFESEVRRIVDAVGLDWEDACLDFHKNDRPVLTTSSIQIRQPIYKGASGYWKNFMPQLQSIKTRLEEHGLTVD